MVDPHLRRSCDELLGHDCGINEIKKDLAEEIYRTSKKEPPLLKQGFTVSSIHPLPTLKLSETLSGISSCLFCGELRESKEHEESENPRRCEIMKHSIERDKRGDTYNSNGTNTKTMRLRECKEIEANVIDSKSTCNATLNCEDLLLLSPIGLQICNEKLQEIIVWDDKILREKMVFNDELPKLQDVEAFLSKESMEQEQANKNFDFRNELDPGIVSQIFGENGWNDPYTSSGEIDLLVSNLPQLRGCKITEDANLCRNQAQLSSYEKDKILECDTFAQHERRQKARCVQEASRNFENLINMKCQRRFELEMEELSLISMTDELKFLMSLESTRQNIQNNIHKYSLKQNKAVKSLPPEQDNLVHRAKLMDIELDSEFDRLKGFHMKKRQLLDNIDIFIPLMSKEIRRWTAPDTEIDCVPMVLSKHSLICFRQQACLAQDGLENERLTVDSLRAEKKRLGSEGKYLEQSVLTMHAKCAEMQMLKFGRKLDIETFEDILQYARDDTASKINKSSDGAKKVVHDAESKSLVESIELSKMTLMGITKQNTHILNDIVKLMETLDIAQTKKKSLNNEAKQDTDIGKARRSSLLLKNDIIGATEQIDNLKSEIRKLQRKDAWIVCA